MNLTEEQIKTILKYCPNYDDIVEFAIPEGDTISQDILKNYREYVFEPHSLDLETLKKIEYLDKMVKEYTDMGQFYRLIQEMGDKPLVDENGFEYVIDFYSYLELLYQRFENQITEGKVGTKWL